MAASSTVEQIKGFVMLNSRDIDDTPAVTVKAEEPKYSVKTLKTPLIDAELSRALACFLEVGWAGPPYNHAFVHEDDPHAAFSPADYPTTDHRPPDDSAALV